MNLTTLSHAYEKAVNKLDRVQKANDALRKQVLDLKQQLQHAIFFIRDETLCECSADWKCGHCETLAKLNP